MRMKSVMLSLIMAMSAAGSSENVYGTSFRGKPKYNPDYKPKQAHREMKEFCINGEKIIAYSRKDAIVRLRHNMAKTKKHKAENDYISEYLLPLQKEGLIIMPRVIGEARILFNITEQVGGKPVGCTIDMESDEYSLTFSTLTYQIGITKDDVWVKMCIYSPAICGCHLDVLRSKINEALADLKEAFSKKKSD